MSRDESEILGEEGEIFSGSREEVEESSLQFYNSPHSSNIAQTDTPKSQGLETPHSPKKPVPPTPGTAPQKKFEKYLRSLMQLQLKQDIRIFQESILEAFNKISEQEKSLQQQINQPSATTVKPSLHSVDQIESDLKPSTSLVLDSNPRTQNLRDTAEVQFVGPPLPHNFKKRGQVLDPPHRCLRS